MIHCEKALLEVRAYYTGHNHRNGNIHSILSGVVL